EVPEQRVEMLARHRLAVIPPDRAFGVRVPDDELVLRRPPRMLPGLDGERARRGQPPLMAADRIFDQLRGGLVPVNLVRTLERKNLGSNFDVSNEPQRRRKT